MWWSRTNFILEGDQHPANSPSTTETEGSTVGAMRFSSPITSTVLQEQQVSTASFGRQLCSPISNRVSALSQHLSRFTAQIHQVCTWNMLK